MYLFPHQSPKDTLQETVNTAVSHPINLQGFIKFNKKKEVIFLCSCEFSETQFSN